MIVFFRSSKYLHVFVTEEIYKVKVPMLEFPCLSLAPAHNVPKHKMKYHEYTNIMLHTFVQLSMQSRIKAFMENTWNKIHLGSNIHLSKALDTVDVSIVQLESSSGYFCGDL